MTPAAIARRSPAKPTSLSCLVVEDHTMFLQLLVGMLRTVPGIHVRATATTVADAVAAVRAEACELLILDLKDRPVNGTSARVLRLMSDS